MTVHFFEKRCLQGGHYVLYITHRAMKPAPVRKDKVKSELTKLNKAQRSKLRKLFSGRTAKSVHVDEAISKVTVDFGACTHWIMLGPRGGVVYHEKGAN